MGTWHNVLLVEVARDIDLDHMKRLGKAHEDLLVDYPAGMVTFAIIGENVPIASNESRAESARFVRALGQSLRRTVMVLENKGVTAQLLQTVIRGINVIARNPKLVIMPTVESGIASVVTMVDGLPQSEVQAGLTQAVAALRAGYATKTAMSA